MGVEHQPGYHATSQDTMPPARIPCHQPGYHAHGSTGSPKQVPKTASIECCARPPVPQVMKVCFTLVLGHRYETCTLVFYRGVFLKKTVAQSALMPHYSIEKMVSKKTCAPPFYRGCFAGGACTPTIYIYKMGGHQCTP